MHPLGSKVTLLAHCMRLRTRSWWGTYWGVKDYVNDGDTKKQQVDDPKEHKKDKEATGGFWLRTDIPHQCSFIQIYIGTSLSLFLAHGFDHGAIVPIAFRANS